MIVQQDERAHAFQTQDNPFLETLGPVIEYMKMATHLAYSPLRWRAVQEIPLAQREDLLSTIKQHVVPTRMAQNVAAALQSLLREHYIQRNPLDAEVRKQVAQLAACREMPIATLPWFPSIASGAIVQGITGTGKTTIVNRYLSLLPQQVRVFSNGEIPGYQVLTQIVWMKVDMSADGSRGGFLLSILAEVDRLSGSGYYAQYSRARLSIEKLMVRVGIVLSTHFCGMLLVEEIQRENFSESKYIKELATFFLRLLNFGIPVVLIGNPLGFEELKHHSQVMRRLTTGGSFHLHPCASVDDFDWKILVQKLWEFDVMPEPLPLTEAIKEKLFSLRGGIPDFLARLIVESQRNALRGGKGAINVNDIDKVFHSPTMQANHDLILGFANQDINRLSGCTDIPVTYYERLWKSEKSGHASSADAAQARTVSTPVETKSSEEIQHAADSEVKSIVKTKEARYKGETTRAANREEKVKKLNASLPSEDMRQKGGKDALLKGLAALQIRLNEKKL
jgi:hypothetical protein